MPRAWLTAFIGLGANLGDPQAAVSQAIAAIAALPQLELIAQSSLYRTAPVDSSGPDYVNAVVQVSTSLTAPDLLAALQGLEHQAGRERPYVNAPRTLDLDVLLYGDAQISSISLMIPHPRMWERAFVIQPLAEIAPDLVPQGLAQALRHQAIEKLIVSNR